MDLIEAKLPSGAMLKISPAPYADALELTQVILREIRNVDLTANLDVADPNLFKDAFCIAFSSKAIETEMWKCLRRSIYNNGKGDFKVEPDTFEPLDSRQDYFPAMYEVAKVNVTPFLKSLFAQYSQILGILKVANHA